MSLNRLTKDQLVKRLKEEEKLSSRLEVDLEDARRRVKELEETSTKALRTAQRASRAVETFRYIQEQSSSMVENLSRVVDGLMGVQKIETAGSSARKRAVEQLRQLSETVAICPKCGNVRPNDEHDNLLCEICMTGRLSG